MAQKKAQTAPGTKPLKGKTRTEPRRAILVVGMHRSGTSALSGLLQHLGCTGPKNPMQIIAENPKGHFESRPLSELHDDVLRAAGSSWYDTQPFPSAWMTSPMASQYRDDLKEMITAEFGQSSLFVVKDPRICRFLPFWVETLRDMNIKPLIVHTHRNPLEVAASLQERNGFETDFGNILWLRHVLDAEASCLDLPRVFTNYAALLENWEDVAARIRDTLDVTWPEAALQNASQLQTFISPDLHHQKVPDNTVFHDTRISHWIRDTYTILERLALGVETAKDAGRLDDIRGAFDTSCIAFGSLAQHKEEVVPAGSTEQAEVTRLKARLKERDASIADLTSRHEATETALSALEDQLTKQTNVIETLTQTHAEEKDAMEAEISSLKDALTQHRTDIEDARAKVTAISKEAEAKQEQLENDLQKLEEDVKQRDTEVAKMSELFLTEQNQNNMFAAKLQAAEASLSANEATLAASKAAWVEIKTQYKKLKVERDALVNSTSWRLTQPLRWLKACLSRKPVQLPDPPERSTDP
ncbi:MAG: sulfotransferase [Pseudomonadota bacterium]